MGGAVRGGLAAVVVLVTASCSGKECSKEYVVPSYRITVIDQKTATPICDATVDPSARRGAGCLSAIDIPTLPGHAPTLDITVSHAGYQSKTTTVSTNYTTDDCDHAVPVDVRIELTPE